MKIVALDLATRCGIAVGEARARPSAWSVDLGVGKSEEDRFSTCLVVVSKLLAEHKPDLLVIERPIGGQQTSHYLVGLVACARGVARNRCVQTKTVAAGTARKHFVGKAFTSRDFPGLSKPKAKVAIKRVVQNRCRQLGWDYDDLDGCDALAIWDYACSTWAGAQAAPLGGLFNG